MSYTPTNWKSGDVVTSAKLNKLEQGVAKAEIAKATLTIDMQEQTAQLDMSYNDIESAGLVYIAFMPPGESQTLVYLLRSYFADEGEYVANFICVTGSTTIGTLTFEASTATEPMPLTGQS